MPNWVRCRVEFDGDDSVAFAERLAIGMQKGDYSVLEDFVPMPEIYKKYDLTNINPDKYTVGDEYPVWEDGKLTHIVFTPEMLLDMKQVREEQRKKYGVVGWYDWHCKYWGTKWQENNLYVGNHMLSFETAWCAPIEGFLAISKQFPEMRMVMAFADEDFGSNCGGCLFYKGKMEMIEPDRMCAALVWDFDSLVYNFDYIFDEMEEEDGSDDEGNT